MTLDNELAECNYILVKTVLGMERLVASYVADLDPSAKIIPSPKGFKGLVLVEPSIDKDKLAELIELRIPEAEKVVVARACSKPIIREIAEKAAALAPRYIKSDESFAVRTVRRGSHDFTSIDVNVAVGDLVKKATNASVNLSNPDKVVAIEIIQDIVLIGFYSGEKIWKKMRKGKYPLYKLFKKLSIVQMPYLGPLDACRTMGIRVGREVQNFEVGELVIAPIGVVSALELKAFLEGVLEGIETRYRIQAKSYGRRVERVKVYVQDLYQFVRSRYGKEPIIVFEPEGEYISKIADELYSLIIRNKRINFLFGSREGIPQGIYRFADLVVDIAPGITLSTEYAASSALIATSTILYDKLLEEESREEKEQSINR